MVPSSLILISASLCQKFPKLYSKLHTYSIDLLFNISIWMFHRHTNLYIPNQSQHFTSQTHFSYSKWHDCHSSANARNLRFIIHIPNLLIISEIQSLHSISTNWHPISDSHYFLILTTKSTSSSLSFFVFFSTYNQVLTLVLVKHKSSHDTPLIFSLLNILFTFSSLSIFTRCVLNLEHFPLPIPTSLA